MVKERALLCHAFEKRLSSSTDSRAERGSKGMRIVLAIDGSTSSEAAVEEIARRPWPADSQVRVISVIEMPAPLTSGPWTYANSYEEQEALERAQAEETLAGAATKL